MTVELLKDLDELAGDVRGVAVKHQRVAVEHLPGVVEEDVLGVEICQGRRLVLRVLSDIATLDVLDRHVLDFEANVVSGGGLRKGLVVHLHSVEANGSKGDNLSWLDDTGLDPAHGHCADTTDLAGVLFCAPPG